MNIAATQILFPLSTINSVKCIFHSIRTHHNLVSNTKQVFSRKIEHNRNKSNTLKNSTVRRLNIIEKELQNMIGFDLKNNRYLEKISIRSPTQNNIEIEIPGVEMPSSNSQVTFLTSGNKGILLDSLYFVLFLFSFKPENKIVIAPIDIITILNLKIIFFFYPSNNFSVIHHSLGPVEEALKKIIYSDEFNLPFLKCVILLSSLINIDRFILPTLYNHSEVLLDHQTNYEQYEHAWLNYPVCYVH
ncbi:hypothetical protein AGLY_015596 [Aphis glycines]|uniref:Uncharacterized protein n=1 Tax=Aphis glycines TaxID=307491 RepID=A0A6G0T046_APHGL|nr:hypothetical protein AGLY_015596 [Aphis glycines]